jgi:hypothetical protein
MTTCCYRSIPPKGRIDPSFRWDVPVLLTSVETFFLLLIRIVPSKTFLIKHNCHIVTTNLFLRIPFCLNLRMRSRREKETRQAEKREKQQIEREKKKVP